MLGWYFAMINIYNDKHKAGVDPKLKIFLCWPKAPSNQCHHPFPYEPEHVSNCWPSDENKHCVTADE